MHEGESRTRRDFIGRVGRLGAAAAVAGAAPGTAQAMATEALARPHAAGEWDLSWVKRIEDARDRAVIDATGIADGFCLQLATRYLDNCDSAYGAGQHRALVVLNLRTRAVPLALGDAVWSRYEIGADAAVPDTATRQHAHRNLWLTVPAGQPPETGSLTDVVKRGAIILVCDFALGHLAKRLAAKSGEPEDAVHRALRAGFVEGATAVPSGIFGLAKAQNAGCAFLSA